MLNSNVKKVAVITRTKNRELLLNRALASVSSQTFRDFVWVIVNDGGERAPVEEIAGKASTSGIEVKVLHHEKSLGMEAASVAKPSVSRIQAGAPCRQVHLSFPVFPTHVLPSISPAAESSYPRESIPLISSSEGSFSSLCRRRRPAPAGFSLRAPESSWISGRKSAAASGWSRGDATEGSGCASGSPFQRR